VLVGRCTQTTGSFCKRVGIDISEEEAKKWPAGWLFPINVTPKLIAHVGKITKKREFQGYKDNWQ
jgi:hypothetical protein